MNTLYCRYKGRKFTYRHNNFVELIRHKRRCLSGLGVDVLVQLLDHLGENLGGLLVKIGHGDSRCQRAEIGVAGGT
jgi:hypothetical protein